MSVNIEASLSKTKVVKSKKKAYRLWLQYQKQFLEQKETLDVKQYDVLMTALLEKACHGKKTGFWARIIQAYEESRTLNIEPSATMYMAVIKAYGVSRDTANVTCVFKEFKKRYMLNPTSYGLYMTALMDCGQLPMAYRTFRDMNHNSNISKQQLSNYLASFVTLCVKRDTIKLGLEAIELFNISDLDQIALEQITQSLWNNYSPKITPLSFESFVSMYIQEKKLTQNDTLYLFTLFDLLCHQPHFKPTHLTLQLLLKDQIKKVRFGKVIWILSTMERLNIENNLDTMNILIEKFGYEDHYPLFIKHIRNQLDSKSIIEEFIKKGDTKLAMHWLKEIKCDDLDCYAIVMEHWLTLGKWDDCIIEYERLKLEVPEIMINRRIVKAVLTARFSNGQDWTLCAKELNRRKITFTTTTVTRILNTMMNLETKKTGQPLVPGQNIITALQLMEKKLNLVLCVEDIGKIISGLGKRGDVENGFRLYTFVRENVSERCASSILYKSMMTSATKNNDIRKLERVWVDMQYRKRYLNSDCQFESKEQHTLTRYNILLNGYASRLPKPDLTKVKKVFQRLLSQNLAPDIVTYNILIKSFVNANNMEAANQIFHKMIASGIQPDNYSTNTILNGWIIRKDWNHVENFVKELRLSTCNNNNLDIVTFNLLVQSFLQLDSKSMNYTHLLKNQNKGSHLKQLQESNTHRDTVKMSSKKIWSIFETTTGYNQSNLKLTQPNAFVTLFSTQPDQVTCKLFMKAFINIKDYTSASKIHKWMTLIPNNKNL